MPTAHKWLPISDLGQDAEALTDGELVPLKRVWNGQKPQLIEGGAIDRFHEQLRREWAIETGIIENVYTLDRGITRTLIERGIDAALIPHGISNQDPTRVALIIQDHYDALDGLFDFVGGQRELSTGYVKELHAAMLRNQETYAVVDQFGNAFEKRLEKGVYKMVPNSPTRRDGVIHEYCPPEHVASEMDRLIELHREHEERNVPPEVEAAWLHHRFAQIHPFADGNGRVARAIASLVFIKAGWFPLIVKREDWTRYIDALEKADTDDLRPLVSMFVEAQRNAVIQIVQLGTDRPLEAAPLVASTDSVDQAIAAARDRLLERGRLHPKEWSKAKATANGLAEIARLRFRQVADQLSSEISLVGKAATFRASSETWDREWTDFQLANNLMWRLAIQNAGQEADFGEYNNLVRLFLDAGRADEIALSFHALGPNFRGLIGVVIYLVILGSTPILLDAGSFQINYEEDLPQAKSRFSNWLERMIVEGLNEWRRTL